VDVQVLFADSDAITQSQQLLDIIQSHVGSHPDGIIMESVGGTALPLVAEAAAKAGIGWVVLNQDAGYISELRKIYPIPLFCVSSDNKMIGCMQGHQLGALLPDGGSALYIQGPSNNDTAIQRTAGMHETRGAIEVKLLRARWTEESSCRIVASWLQLSTFARAHIDVIAAQNDAMAMGARKAFANLAESSRKQHWLDIPYVGVDGVRSAGLAWVKQGLLRATVVVPPNASKALEILTQAVRSGLIPPEMTTLLPEGYPSLERLRAQGLKRFVASPS
jgi:ribose transport system substrate-binding protein